MFGGYLIDDRARARFGELALRGDEEKLWEWLDEDIGRLEPDYTYPPFLLSLALDLMRGSGWKGGVVPSELARAAGSADVDILLFQCADAALPQSECPMKSCRNSSSRISEKLGRARRQRCAKRSRTFRTV
jgi:hypothetical protein